MKSQILEALKKLQAGDIKDRMNGICDNIAPLIKKASDSKEYVSAAAVKEIIQPIFEKWDYFSGYTEYPVPSPNPNVCSAGAYYHSQDDEWLDDEYGNKRRNLLSFLIQELENELK